VPPKDEDGPPPTASKVNSWAQIITRGTAKTSTDEVTQVKNDEEDATNTENINTIHTPTHRREQAQARITSKTLQAKEGTTTLEEKQNNEYTDRRAEGMDLDSGNISNSNTGQGVDSEWTGQLPIITPEHQKTPR
jgi:hypothetical protein